jgi:hypothetical protein
VASPYHLNSTQHNEAGHIASILKAIDRHKQNISKCGSPRAVYGEKATTREKLLKTIAGYSKSYAKTYEIC